MTKEEQKELWRKIVIETLGISEFDLQALENRIEANLGHVRIWMHPFYMEKDPKADLKEGTRDFKVNNYLNQGLERYLKSALERGGSSPLFIFEEVSEMERTRARILKIVGKEKLGNVYFIQTMNEYGLPDPNFFLPKLGQQISDDINSDLNKALHIFKHIFYSVLGVRSVTIAGSYFEHDDRPEIKTRLNQCAGQLFDWLTAVGVKCDMSKYSWVPREYLKSLGVQTKYTNK